MHDTILCDTVSPLGTHVLGTMSIQVPAALGKVRVESPPEATMNYSYFSFCIFRCSPEMMVFDYVRARQSIGDQDFPLGQNWQWSRHGTPVLQRGHHSGASPHTHQ